MGSHVKKKDQTRYRGLGCQRRQSAQATWVVVMGERARGQNSRRRKFACHPVPRRILEAQNSASGARMEAPTSSKQKSSKRLGETRHSNVHPTAEGEDTDEHPERTTESDPGRCGSHLCQNVGARNSCHGAVPSLWLRERRPRPPLVGKAEQYAHIREKAPQHTNVEDMHPANSEMLVQKDTQLLNWGRDNRTNEVAAVAASEELRSKLESARNRDDGSKISAGKAAEELGGYLCDGRLHSRKTVT